MKLKVIIEVECGPTGELGGLILHAKSSRSKNGPVLRSSFLESTPKPARDLVKLCFDLDRMAREAK